MCALYLLNIAFIYYNRGENSVIGYKIWQLGISISVKGTGIGEGCREQKHAKAISPLSNSRTPPSISSVVSGGHSRPA